MLRGAEVTLVKASTTAEPPMFVDIVPVTDAESMFEEVVSRADAQDIIIKTAAVSDYTPVEVSSEKVKKKDGELNIQMKRTKDILKYVGEHKKENQFVCGFSMETENMLENSKKKLAKKNADMIIANNLKDSGAGFGTDTNLITVITENKAEQLELMSKEEAAKEIIDRIIKLI